MPSAPSLSIKERIRQLKRAVKHESLLCLTGQKWRQTSRIPPKTQRILWIYDWNDGIGDSIIGLSQRFIFPKDIAVDLCITKGPAELFRGDTLFRRVYQRLEECPPDYDFILLQRLGSASLKLKLRYYPHQPFAIMVTHPGGEPNDAFFDYVSLRMAQLLCVPVQPPSPPRISPTITAGIAPQDGCIAVALGGRDGRRRWRDWPGLLDALVRDWPLTAPQPRFVLIGNGPSARDDLAGLPTGFVERHCTVRLDLPDLAEAAREIQRCTLFIGADGGLMHIAAALGKPGVALFAEIRPEWRLLPDNPLTPLYTPGAMADIPLAEIAATFIAAVQRTAATAPQLSDTP